MYEMCVLLLFRKGESHPMMAVSALSARLTTPLGLTQHANHALHRTHGCVFGVVGLAALPLTHHHIPSPFKYRRLHLSEACGGDWRVRNCYVCNLCLLLFFS